MSLNRVASKLIALPRWGKKIFVLSLDMFLCLLTAWFAFCLRLDEFVSFNKAVLLAAAVSMVFTVPLFVSLGLYRAIYRYSGWFATVSLIRAMSLYTLMYAVVIIVIGMDGVPRSIGLIQPLLLFVGVGVIRLFGKWFLNGWGAKLPPPKIRSVALIYGAGSAGRQLASGLRQGVEIKPVAFVDDDPSYWKASINGLRVYAPYEIPSLLSSKLGITDVLLAMPSATRARQREILKLLADLPVHVRILPGITHLANGVVKVEDVREVEIEDVLGREPVQANKALLHQNIADKVVLVTGAGGSIGSELCRQILAQQPKTLVLFELSEFALYTIERELTLMQAPVSIVPILGSVLDANKLKRVCHHFGVQTIFHAAAYKHVPMIEMNPAAGVWNNVFGTLRTVEGACQCEVETFVLVSTDKAVRPTNVMGCSKRMAELVLQAKSLQENRLGKHTTKLTMVRFGNVLGSSGSVVPVFREQIKNGGPVTVTHPEIIRYFMTIPEAAQLVIQAGAMGEGGDVMVLDMGEPIKIVDLAKRMIHLSGFSHKDDENPDGDIEIRFLGLRPGEKLYEELLIGDNTLPTSHSRIMRASEHALRWDELEPLLFELEAAVKAENSDAIRLLLKKAVPEFNPLS
jgi:FlaA1/EpsC-like NDP-sugar epimerase